MTDDLQPTAWMIRNDGKEIPVPYHIKGDTADPFKTLYAAQWLYGNTAVPESRGLALQFIGAYGKSEEDEYKSPMQALIKMIRYHPYAYLSESFLLDHYEEIPFDSGDVDEMNKRVIDALNREFLRARYGGMHETEPGCKDMYFLICSEETDWTDVIYSFITRHTEWIQNVEVYSLQPDSGEFTPYYGPNDCFLCNSVHAVIRDMQKDRNSQLYSIIHWLSFYQMDACCEHYFSVPIFQKYIIPAYDYIKKYMIGDSIRTMDCILVRELAHYTRGFDSVEELFPEEIAICRDVAEGLLKLIEWGGKGQPEPDRQRRMLPISTMFEIEFESGGVAGIPIDKTIDLDDLENEVALFIAEMHEEKRELEESMRKPDAEDTQQDE